MADGADRLRSDVALTRPGDAADLTGDASRARERLGWKPSLTFTEIVARMVDADLPPR
jgi:GDPmannose 4,6-dehydratase